MKIIVEINTRKKTTKLISRFESMDSFINIFKEIMFVCFNTYGYKHVSYLCLQKLNTIL